MVVMESTEMQHRMPAWYDRYETTSGEIIRHYSDHYRDIETERCFNFAGSSLYPSKLGSEPAPGGAAPYFSSSMQTAYGQQGEFFIIRKKMLFL